MADLVNKCGLDIKDAMQIMLVTSSRQSSDNGDTYDVLGRAVNLTFVDNDFVIYRSFK